MSSGTAPRLTPARLEAFSDGIFAIAATLLGLELTVPESGPLLSGLAAAWPTYLTYVVTFLTIAVVWVNHHHAFAALQQVDGPVLWSNIALLVCIGAVPFVNSLLARHLGTPEAGLAAAVYGLLFAVATCPWVVIWSHVRRHPGLLHAAARPSTATVNLGRSLVGIGIYLAAAVVGLFAATVAVVLYLVLALFFAASSSHRGTAT